MRKIIVGVILLGGISSYFYLNKNTTKFIGMGDIISTPIVKGSIFISSDGNGTECTEDSPCHFSRLDLFSKNKLTIKIGSTVFFREGIYSFSMDGVKRIYLSGGDKTKVTTYEAYQDEKVIFDGSKIDQSDTKDESWREGRLELRDSYTVLKNIEVQNMPQNGIRIAGNHNLIEGCIIHDNALSGIEIFNEKDGYSTKSRGGSFNVIQNNRIFNNSDVDLKHHNYGDGDNADGITIHSGVKNLITHNDVYLNSDDGIDTWRSMGTIVEYNNVYSNGKGALGDGNGIKLGGAPKDSPLGANAIARHNLSYANRSSGININAGKNVLMEYNTAYNNQAFGYTLEDDTKLKSNISFKNKKGDFGWSKGLEQTNNSWQLDGNLSFVSLDSNSFEFLKPLESTPFNKIGAYAIEFKKE